MGREAAYRTGHVSFLQACSRSDCDSQLCNAAPAALRLEAFVPAAGRDGLAPTWGHPWCSSHPQASPDAAQELPPASRDRQGQSFGALTVILRRVIQAMTSPSALSCLLCGVGSTAWWQDGYIDGSAWM